ncbi:MAG: DUF2058 domain-containing protein [Gammaproteobacteria bacterium]|nr:DUF2058 domain-containing protein [Gammaproteobacteria bacterium]
MLQKLVSESRLNDPSGDIAHHFSLNGAIKTVYVNRRQHEELTCGELAIVVLSRRHHLVSAHVAAKVKELDPHIPVVITKALPIDDGVPDDLMW